MPNYYDIIEKLRTAKENSRLTLKELAEKSGLTQGTVNKIMSGALKSINTEKLQLLANALNISLSTLLDNESKSTIESPASELNMVRVACVSPNLVVGDCKFNSEEIIKRVKQCAKDDVKIVVFPELAITGYTCGDLLYKQTLLENSKLCLKHIAESLKDENILVSVGLPLCVDSQLFNVSAFILGGDVLGFVPKVNLPNYNEFEEKRHFTPAKTELTYIDFFGAQVPFGSKLLFKDTLNDKLVVGCEICEDIWVANSPSYRLAECGATLIINNSASDETVIKAEYRRKLVEIQSGKTTSAYLYCSCGMDESTSSVVFSAHNIIAENSFVIGESKPFESGYAVADVDLDIINNERTATWRNSVSNDCTIVNFTLPLNTATKRVFPRTPFVPTNNNQMIERCETILKMQCYALKKRIEHTNCKKLVIGVSGGCDSTLALIVCVKTLELLDRPLSDIIAITMPCLGTTARTKNNAIELAKHYCATIKEIDITKSVAQHLKDIGHDINNNNNALENAQARERTQVLMDVANDVGGIVIGTGDLSELALGWCTYNGDQMSMYCVNGGVPKTAIKAILIWQASISNTEIKRIILDVLDTPISPELLPTTDGKIQQKTEDIIGSYELNDYFLFMLIRYGFKPSKAFTLACMSFTEISKQEIYERLRQFIWRFFTQQFKRSASPDCIKIGSVSLNNCNWHMPNDVSPKTWLDELESVKDELQ